EGILRKHVTRDFVRLNKVQGSPVTWLEIKEKVDGVLAGKVRPTATHNAQEVKA
ncbi:MAG: hypothetical protein QOI63_1834, partial [Thermoplasmata archaeon]|nr:hypothetical protein [Thermoplasmata archaeon]